MFVVGSNKKVQLIEWVENTVTRIVQIYVLNMLLKSRSLFFPKKYPITTLGHKDSHKFKKSEYLFENHKSKLFGTNFIEIGGLLAIYDDFRKKQTTWFLLFFKFIHE